LIVEDDFGIAEDWRQRLSRYEGSVTLRTCTDAGEALAVLRESPPPDAVVLDIMMPYGSSSAELHGDTDPDEMETGLRLLRAILDQEGQPPAVRRVWVAVATARSPLAVDATAKRLFAGRGVIYYKPYDPNRLEDDLMKALDIPSKVPAILLPGMDASGR
jgi:CheY-like chemotaxis protein